MNEGIKPDFSKEREEKYMSNVVKRITVDIEIPDEIFEKIIDNVTEFMYCNFGECHMQCSWKELEEIRNYIKTEGLDKVKDI